MEFVALVTLLIVGQYTVFMGLCGKARAQSGIKAPQSRGPGMIIGFLSSLVMRLTGWWGVATQL